MMVADEQHETITVEEYLRAEEFSTVKHEYVYGHVYAMAGGTLGHDRTCNSIRALIFAHLRGTPCYLQGPDAMLRVSPEIYYYPDAFVHCGETIDATAKAVSRPRLIVEVLSDSTEAIDRGAKFRNYQTLDSCDEYLLIDGRRCVVELFRRGERNLWLYRLYGPDDSLTLETIGLTCTLAEIYEGTGL
jgi:Uma2 family endonuclease